MVKINEKQLKPTRFYPNTSNNLLWAVEPPLENTSGAAGQA